jgi:hypothetical protein
MKEDRMIARLKFLGSENQGRFHPPLSGYHPAVHIHGEYTSCSLFPVDELIHMFTFNQEYEVVVRLMFPDRYVHQLHPGNILEFSEGTKKVAQGILLSL